MFVKIFIVFLYFIILFLIGLFASRKIKNIKDFFVGGKKFGYWLVSFSARATGESGWLLLGLTGLGFALGLQAMWVIMGEVMCILFAWMFMVRRFKVFTDKYESITIPDYLESRFSDKTKLIRIISGLTLAIFVTAYISAQYTATGKAFEGFLNINYNTGVLIGVGIVLFYTVAGGFIAVVWSDLLQGSLMLLGLVLIPIVTLFSIGGFAPLFTGLAKISPALLSPWGGEFGIVGLITALGFISIGFGFLGSPQLFVRFISVRDEKELINGSLVAVFYTILTDLGAVFTGMCGRVLYFATDISKYNHLIAKPGNEELILPYLSNDLFPLIIAGLFIAIVLAAIMSTADSLLVIASSSVVRDIYQKVFHSHVNEKKLTLLSRIITAILCLIAVLFALKNVPFLPAQFMEKIQTFVFWFVLFGWAGITATFCPVMILSLFWKRTTTPGAISGMLAGALTTVIWKLISAKYLISILPFIKPVIRFCGKDPAGIEHLADVMYEMIPAFFVSLLFIVIVSLFTKPPENADKDFKYIKNNLVEFLN